MAEIQALIESVSTLCKCIVKLKRVAGAYNHVADYLRRYQMVLENIEKSTALIKELIEGSDAVRAIQISVHGKSEKLVDFYTKNVTAVVEDVQTLLQRFGDSESREVAGIVERVKSFFIHANRALNFMLDEKFIKQLLESAKHVETSQFMALSTVLLVDNFKKEDRRETFDMLTKTMIAQSESFNSMRRTYQRKEQPVLRLRLMQKARPNRFGTRKGGSVTEADGVLESSRHNPLSEDRSQPISQEAFDPDNTEDSTMLNSLLQNTDECQSTSAETALPEDTIAIMRYDGTFEVLDNRPDPEDIASASTASAALDIAVSEPSEKGDLETGSELGSACPFFSDSEDFEAKTVTDAHGPHPTMPIYDSAQVDVNIDEEVFIFIDQAVNLDNCTSSIPSAFQFCVRTLLVPETGSPSLILKEPCKTAAPSCNHIKVSIQSDTISGQVFPCSLQASLLQGPMPASGTLHRPSQERLALFVLSDCRQRSSRTLVLTRQGACKQYAIPTSLEIVYISDVSTLGEGSGESDEAEDNISGEATTETHHHSDLPQAATEQADNEEVSKENAEKVEERNFGLWDFSRVPCFFCERDALRPVADSAGVFGLLVYKNSSFGYTCQRCRDRTWISGAKFGLTGVGGSWIW